VISVGDSSSAYNVEEGKLAVAAISPSRDPWRLLTQSRPEVSFEESPYWCSTSCCC
jgi:hypothetical protein